MVGHETLCMHMHAQTYTMCQPKFEEFHSEKKNYLP